MNFAKLILFSSPLFRRTYTKIIAPLQMQVTKKPLLSLQHFFSTHQPSSSSLEIENYVKNAGIIQLLKAGGFKTLFPIQARTYNDLFNGKDLLASDRTGSGKTLAYSLPIVERILQTNSKKGLKFLILCPTRY